jgi:hypothetical protein
MILIAVTKDHCYGGNNVLKGSYVAAADSHSVAMMHAAKAVSTLAIALTDSDSGSDQYAATHNF